MGGRDLSHASGGCFLLHLNGGGDAIHCLAVFFSAIYSSGKPIPIVVVVVGRAHHFRYAYVRSPYESTPNESTEVQACQTAVPAVA